MMKNMSLRMLFLSIFLLLSFSQSAFAGWERDDKGWWWKNADGSWPHEEWKKIDGKWYYFHQDGYMAYYTWIGDYFVGDDGAMLTNNITPDGYHVDAAGKRYGSPDDEICWKEFAAYNGESFSNYDFYYDYYLSKGIIDISHATVCRDSRCKNSRVDGSLYCVEHKCHHEGCMEGINYGYPGPYCIKHFGDYYEDLKKKDEQYEARKAARAAQKAAVSKTSGTASNSGKGSSYSHSSSSSGSGSRKTYYYDSYDDGYEDIWLNDDYDDDRYRWDSDYAAGVDDAMDEFDW